MIAAHYEEDPESFHEEIRQLDQLREVFCCACASYQCKFGPPEMLGVGV